MNSIKFITLIILLPTINCNVEWDMADGIVTYVSDNLSIEMVTFLSDQTETLRRVEVEDLFHRIVKNISTLNLNVDNFIKLNEDPQGVLRSISSLIIYMHYPIAEGVLPSSKVIDIMKEESLDKTVVKYLVIHYSKERNDYLDETLKYAWNDQRMLDFTIIEIINGSSQMMNREMMVSDRSSTILIRQYNPFLNKIHVSPYSERTELFPRFIDDMHGYPLKIGMRHLLPFSSVIKLANGQVKFGGANKIFMETLSEVMNCTPIFVARGSNHNFHIDQMLAPMIQNKFDIDARLYAHLTENATVNAMLTAPVDDDELCAVVPYIRKERSLDFSMETFGVYMFAILILTLFWILERFAHLDSHFWSPFIVIKVLFAVAVRRHPTHSADRIMFMSLVLVAMVYSTKLFTSMTQGVVSRGKTSEWETLEELSASDLTLIIHPLYFNKTFQYAEGVVLNLKEKTLQKPNVIACLTLLLKNKNVSCLMSRNEYKVAERYVPQRTIKLVSPCFWKDSTAFFLASKSPYHERIRQIITHFHEKGFKEKWYHMTVGKRTIPNQFDSSKSVVATNNVLKPSIIILSIGYTLATIVFIGELIYHQKFDRT